MESRATPGSSDGDWALGAVTSAAVVENDFLRLGHIHIDTCFDVSISIYRFDIDRSNRIASAASNIDFSTYRDTQFWLLGVNFKVMRETFAVCLRLSD